MEYIDVIADPRSLDRMLSFSDGRRKIPVVVDGDRILIGYQGKG